MPGWGSSRCPHGQAAGVPVRPSPQRVDSARWICVTTAPSSSPTPTWGSSALAPTTAQHSPAGSHTGVGDDGTTTKRSQPHRRCSPPGFPLIPHPREADGLSSAADRRGLHPHPQGSCSERSPQKGRAGNRASAVAPPDSTGVLWVPHAHLPPLPPHQGRTLPPYLFPRLQLGAGGHGRAGVACGREKMLSGTGCSEGWGAALA